MTTQIDENIFRGPMPDDAFWSLGFRSILNLETQTRELIYGDPNKEFRNCIRTNTIYYDMAWSGLFPPKPVDVYAALISIEHSVKPLYFHCRAGRERTGFLCAVYRMQRMGWSFEDAYKEWKTMGCRWPTWWLWKKELRKYEIIR